MARTFQRPGLTLTHTAGGTISAGDPVAMADIVGIALSDAVSGEDIEVSVEGVHEVPKTTGEAWVQGDIIAWDASAEEFTKTITAASGDVENAGVAALDAASADAVGFVKLTPGAGTGTA